MDDYSVGGGREMRKIIMIEEDDDGGIRPYPHPIRRNPIEDGYICPICGRHVGSMEVHPCNQPYCGGTYA